MNSLADEIELLARLEIETILENNQLGDFATAVEELFNFPMSQIISEYFIGGARFGVEIEDDTSNLDKDLFILSIHEQMRESLKKSNFQHTDEEEAVKLFEKLFLQGMYWSITHQNNKNF